MKLLKDKTEVMAYFCLFGDEFDPNHVTSILKIEPTNTAYKGDIINEKLRVKETSWTLGTELQRRNEIEGYTKDLKLIPQNRGYVTFYPDGAAIGTAEDLGKFLAALMPVDDSHVLFKNRDTLNEMLSTSLYYEGTSTPRFAHGFVEMEYTGCLH